MKCQSHRHAASVIIFDKIGCSIDRVHNKCITFTNCFAVFSFLTDKYRLRQNFQQFFLQISLNRHIILCHKICPPLFGTDIPFGAVCKQYNIAAFFDHCHYFIKHLLIPLYIPAFQDLPETSAGIFFHLHQLTQRFRDNLQTAL